MCYDLLSLLLANACGVLLIVPRYDRMCRRIIHDTAGYNPASSCRAILFYPSLHRGGMLTPVILVVLVAVTRCFRTSLMLDSSPRFLQPPEARFPPRVIDGIRPSPYSLLSCVFEGYSSSVWSGYGQVQNRWSSHSGSIALCRLCATALHIMKKTETFTFSYYPRFMALAAAKLMPRFVLACFTKQVLIPLHSHS